MFSETDIVDIIISMIKPEYLEHSKITLRKNLSSYNSIIVTSDKSPYRNLNTSELLFARISTTTKTPYISFNSKYRELFSSYRIDYYEVKSEPNFIRFDISIFSQLSPDLKKLPLILNKIFIELFSFPAFGCCSKYMQCSDKKRCVHEDLAYSSACIYGKNLLQGKVFYGKNRNID